MQLWAGRPCSIPSWGKVFVFAIASRPILGPTQHAVQWVRVGGGGAFSGGQAAGS
jgi:hypothetical protein